MTSATGKAPRRKYLRSDGAGSCGAFSLVEILLVLALLGLLGGLGIAATGSLFGGRVERAGETFWEAVRQGRSLAIQTESPVVLGVAENKRMLILQTKSDRRTFNLPEGTTLDFSSIGIPWETRDYPIRSGFDRQSCGVSFYRDGTCDGLRARLAWPDGRNLALTVDPWTCARLAMPADGG